MSKVLSPEEMEMLLMLTKKMGIDSDELVSFPKSKKSTSAVALYTEKYEIVHHCCSLCGTEWINQFGMQKFTDNSLRGKKVETKQVPETAKKETLYYSHRHCGACKKILSTWSKESILDVLLNDRRNYGRDY